MDIRTEVLTYTSDWFKVYHMASYASYRGLHSKILAMLHCSCNVLKNLPIMLEIMLVNSQSLIVVAFSMHLTDSSQAHVCILALTFVELVKRETLVCCLCLCSVHGLVLPSSQQPAKDDHIMPVKSC